MGVVGVPEAFCSRPGHSGWRVSPAGKKPVSGKNRPGGAGSPPSQFREPRTANRVSRQHKQRCGSGNRVSEMLVCVGFGVPESVWELNYSSFFL